MGVAAMLLTVIACKKGDTGPEGPPGSANVIYSGWLSFQQAQLDTIVDGTNLKINHIPAPEVNQDIIDGGLIIVYTRFLTNVFQLPYTSDAGTGTGPTKTNTVNFIPKPGMIYITRYTHDNTASIGFGTVQFRYVLIPGGVQANAALRNMDTRNYDMVKAAFALPE